MELNVDKAIENAMNDIDVEKIVERKLKKYINEYMDTQFEYEQTYRGEFIKGDGWSAKIQPVIDDKINDLLKENAEKLVEEIFNKQVNLIVRNIVDSRAFTEMACDEVSTNVAKLLRKKLKA